MGHAKGLRAVLRCHLHSGQRSLENAIRTDPDCNALVQELILAYSSKDSFGSLARGIKNSLRVRKVLADNVLKDMETLDHHLKHMVNFRFAPQRFDSVLEVARLICLHVKPIVRTLVQLKLASDDAKMSNWSGKMLAFFQVPHLIRLALLAELAASASKYHHHFDNAGTAASKNGNASTLAKTGFWFKQLQAELKKLFSFEDGEPLVLNEAYTSGFLQTMRRRVNLLIDESCICQEKLVFFRSGSITEGNLRKQVAVELGSIQNVTELYLLALGGEHQADYGVASALGPFDTNFWQSEFSDDRLSEPQTWS